jgi:excinuclease ABC subunit C
MTNAKAKTVKKSSLEKIKGIGSSKAKSLLAHFGGIAAIKNATFDELIAVKGISKSDAENIVKYYTNGV